MLYVDTSVWVALVAKEARGPDVDTWLAQQAESRLITARWTTVEFASALGVKVRSSQMSAAFADACWQSFESLIDGRVVVLDPEPEVVSLAAALCRRYPHGLRAGDALHIAVARAAEASAFVTLDDLLAAQAKRLRLNPLRL